MKHGIKIVSLALLLISLDVFSTPAWAGHGYMGGRHPYGGYCRGPRWGWYGARTPVTTVDGARKHLEKYFEGQENTIGTISDHGLFFKAEIKDRENTVVDYVIIDKRTGRIRSTF